MIIYKSNNPNPQFKKLLDKIDALMSEPNMHDLLILVGECKAYAELDLISTSQFNALQKLVLLVINEIHRPNDEPLNPLN